METSAVDAEGFCTGSSTFGRAEACVGADSSTGSRAGVTTFASDLVP